MTVTSDLILTESGDIMYVQDQPFAQEITRAEFYIETGFLIFVFENEDSRMVEREIEDPAIKQAISSAPHLYITWIKDGIFQDGFEVPLIAVHP